MSHALFAYCAFLTWFAHFDRSRPRFAVTHRDGTTVDDGYFAIAMNSNPYTYLGTRPFDVIPEATLDRGLGLVTLRSLDALTLLGVVGSALGRRRFLQRSRKVDLRTDLDGFSVRGHGPFPTRWTGTTWARSSCWSSLTSPMRSRWSSRPARGGERCTPALPGGRQSNHRLQRWGLPREMLSRPLETHHPGT